MKATAIGAVILAFVVGCLLGSLANQPTVNRVNDQPTVNRVNEWMDKMPLGEQYDFLRARLTFLPGVRRKIAEDWCFQNPKTLRVCHNARKYGSPVNVEEAE